MNKQLIALGIIGILIAISISGCLENNKEDNGSITHLSGKVTVTTNKIEYRQNETINITFYNGLNVSIYINQMCCFIEQVEKKTSDGWLIYLPDNCLTYVLILEEVKPGQYISFEWSPIARKYGTSSYSYLEPGIYRIKSGYNLSENNTWQTVYSNEFTIKEQETHLKCEPTVVVTGINYSSNPNNIPYNEAHTRFKENYTGSDLSIELRNAIVQNITEKVEQLGENSPIIYEAIKVTYGDWKERPMMIPCYAEKAIYNDEPVWIIAFNRCNGFEGDIGHYDIFYVSIQTLETQWYTGCNSSSVVYWFGCD